MTEIKRLLSVTLTALEQELRQAQEAQSKTLAKQDKILTVQASVSCHLQEEVRHLKAQQQESTQYLQKLINTHEKLESLLIHFNAILSNAQKQ